LASNVHRRRAGKIGVAIERRAVVDRRLDAAADRRHDRSNAHDLYARIEEKRLALRTDRRYHLRRESDHHRVVEASLQTSLGPLGPT